jgi:dihydroorotase-like cyclic amidohydrolase
MIDAVNKKKININQLAYLLSEGPAKLFGVYPQKGSLLVGTDADITIVDLNKKFTIEKEKLHSVSKVTAFDGFEIHGAPVQTIVRGTTVMKDGEIISRPIGKFIKA